MRHKTPAAPITYYIFFCFLIIGANVAYTYLAYFHERKSFFIFLGVIGFLFAGYAFFLTAKPTHFKLLIVFGILFRLIGLMAFPTLSDDYFRFFWDGTLLANAYNPYLYLPSELIRSPEAVGLGFDKALFEALNSPDYYTVYPPFNQLIFAFAVWVASYDIWAAVLVMRLVIFGAELMSLFFLYQLLKFYKLPTTCLLGYWLNPLVIIEAVGNLHFEGVMFAFVLMGIYFLQVKNNLYAAGFAFALAIVTKLIPLLMLPLLWRYLGLKRGFIFCAFTGILVILSFVPFLSSALFANLSSSVGLYFQKFEFNASVYYLFRSLGFWWYGYNIIATLGRMLSVLTLVGILSIAFFFPLKKPQHLPLALLWSLSFYYLLATTIHPWYVLMLLGLSVFTPYKFAFLWSFTVLLSYAAYLNEDYSENLVWVGIEYALVLLWLVVEWYRQRHLYYHNTTSNL